jgi:hypothetical protein
MNQVVRMSRRFFVIGGTTVGGGLALGLKLSDAPEAASAQPSDPEVNAWAGYLARRDGRDPCR